MDYEDDDFGDLYADVEGEASSAMNAAPQCSQIQCVNDELDTHDDDNDKACVDIDTEEDDDDDDDDDLDIVLNSGDDNVRPAEGFMISRNNTNLQSRQLDDEDDDNLDAEESMGGKVVDNSHSLYKYLRSQSTAYGSDIKGIECMTAAYYWQQTGSRSTGPQNAERFSLPRARSILDVNIDIFSLKPWRHPGADITDYFNFGFNEESWKLYCSQVDEYRHRGPVSGGTPPSEPAQSTEVDTSRGQAIQVEESIYERQSSMDITCQLDRDTDVIEITIVDQDDKCVPEASNHGDVSGDDDVTDHLSFSSASEDDTIEGNYIKEDLEIHQVVTDETIRNLNDSKESNLVEELTESFEDDRCLTELTRSMKPDYHRSEDSMKSDDKRRLYENIYHSRMLGDKRKHGDRTLHERCDNPAYNNRTHKDFNLKTHQDRSYTELTSSMNRGYRHPKADDKRRHDENRYHTRKYGDGVYHERCNNHVHKDLNTKTHHENDDIISGRTVDKRKYGEQRYHARHSSGYFPRSDDPYNEENMLYSKSEISSGERFYGYEDWDTKRFGSNRGRSISRFSEDDEYFCGQRRYNEDKRMMVGDWYHYEKGLKKGEKLLLRNKGEFQFEPRCFDGENFEPFMYYDQKSDDFEYNRWEFGRNKRRVCSLSSELNDPPSLEESHVMISKGSLYRRHGSYGGQSFDSFDTEKHITNEIMFRREDSRFCGYGNSFPLEKVSRRSKRFVSDRVKELIDDRYVVGSQLVDHGSGYVEELTDGQPANGCRYYRQKNEVFSFQRLPLSSRNSKSVVGEVKSTEKHKKPKKINFNTHLKDKVARTDESRAIDEAQILTEEVKVGRGHVNEPGNENGKSGVDNTRILEAMAKMEKRRARFNDPITITGKSSDSSNKLAVGDSAQETASVKQERPVRKRRWGGS